MSDETKRKRKISSWFCPHSSWLIGLPSATAQGALGATTLFHPVRLHFALMLFLVRTQRRSPFTILSDGVFLKLSGWPGLFIIAVAHKERQVWLLDVRN